MKKIFALVNPSTRERIERTSKEQNRECVMVSSPDDGVKWVLDGFPYTTGQVSAVLGIDA